MHELHILLAAACPTASTSAVYRFPLTLTDDDPASNSDDGPQPSDRLLQAALDRLPPGLLTRKAIASGSGSCCRLEIQNPCRYPEVGARRLRGWLGAVLAELSPSAQTFTVRFISDREMRGLNSTYRQIDRPTDVLSFPGDLELPEAGHDEADEQDLWPDSGHLGDVAISVPTARRQAVERAHDAHGELRLLLLHGLLHCLGFDHEQDNGEMEALESALRARYLAPGGSP